jgi:hypothetical protein
VGVGYHLTSGNSAIERLQAARHSDLLICVPASQKPIQAASDRPPPPGLLGADSLGLPEAVAGDRARLGDEPPPVANWVCSGSDMGESAGKAGSGLAAAAGAVTGGSSPAGSVAAAAEAALEALAAGSAADGVTCDPPAAGVVPTTLAAAAGAKVVGAAAARGSTAPGEAPPGKPAEGAGASVPLVGAMAAAAPGSVVSGTAVLTPADRELDMAWEPDMAWAPECEPRAAAGAT